MTASTGLNVENVSYSFGRTLALDQVEFSIGKGSCTMLLGPNGAGKTTLFSLITRLYDTRNGHIDIDGINLKRKTSRALARLGVVFQQSTLDLDLNISQNLRYHAALHGMSRKHSRQRIRTELERQNMFERRYEKIRQLNGGHRRRVEIARALLHEPSVLLLDEPTVGLDVPSRQGIVRYLHELCSAKDIAILWATHLIDEIDDSDHLVVLHKGTIRAQGSVQQVLLAADAGSVGAAFHNLTAGE